MTGNPGERNKLICKNIRKSTKSRRKKREHESKEVEHREIQLQRFHKSDPSLREQRKGELEKLRK